jgi:chromosome segregation ATPase
MEFAKSLIQNQTVIQNQTAKISEQVTQITEQKELILNQKNEIEGLTKTIAQKEEIITNQASAIETLNGKVAELSKQIADINTATKNARRERIYNQYLPGTKKAFEARKEDIFDDGKYEELIFEMNQYQANVKQPPTEESGTVDVANQGNEKPKFINGVIMRFGPDGKPVFEEA